MIEIDDALELVKLVGYLPELYLQQVLLCGEHLEVAGVSVFHQELCVPYGSLKAHYLFLVRLS